MKLNLSEETGMVGAALLSGDFAGLLRGGMF